MYSFLCHHLNLACKLCTAHRDGIRGEDVTKQDVSLRWMKAFASCTVENYTHTHRERQQEKNKLLLILVNCTGIKEHTQSIKTNRFTDQSVSVLLSGQSSFFSLGKQLILTQAALFGHSWPINLLQLHLFFFYVINPLVNIVIVRLQLCETQSVQSRRQDSGSLRVFDLSQNSRPGIVGFVIPASETKR